MLDFSNLPSNISSHGDSYRNMFFGMPNISKVWVKDATAQTWVINNGGNSNLTSSNVLIKGA